MRGLSALIVDDDHFVRGLMARQLLGLGATRVAMASSGDRARKAITEEGPFDLIICDLLMPGMDGVQVLREVSELQPDASVLLVSSVEPKILQTAERIARNRQLRVCGSLRKPLAPNALADVVRRVQQQEPRQPGAAAAAPARAATTTREELRAAIDAGQIGIAVQPKLRLSDHRLYGVEVLARWTRPDGSSVPPSAFIPVAEESGLIDRLTTVVIERSIEAWKQWRKDGLVLSMAINVAIQSLHRLNLVDSLMKSIDACGIEPGQITLEVTESGVATDETQVMDLLTRLRLRGVALSIDDFGTGYSSMRQLQNVPFTELKIDRGFVATMATDPGSRTIVESSIKLAHDLGIASVAEGIETAAQLEQLEQLGCDYAQGYLIARPMAAGELVGWARGSCSVSA